MFKELKIVHSPKYLYLNIEKDWPGFFRESSHVNDKELNTCTPVCDHEEETEKLKYLYEQWTQFKNLKHENCYQDKRMFSPNLTFLKWC